MPRPRFEKKARKSSDSASPSSSGPTTIPKTISRTTTGNGRRADMSPATKAARAATTTTVRKDPLSTSIMAAGALYGSVGRSGDDMRLEPLEVHAPVPSPCLAGVGDVGAGAGGERDRRDAGDRPAAAGQRHRRPPEPADSAVRGRADHGGARRRDDHLHGHRLLGGLRGSAN